MLMANMTITSIIDKEDDLGRVILHGRHSCDLKSGMMAEAQFHFSGTHKGVPELCGCQFVVAPGIWDQVTRKYRLRRKLEGL